MSTLYLVSTPIGNLEDMSPRAVRILRQVGLIAVEDTRLSRKLLTHFDIHTPLTSYHEHNRRFKLSKVLSALAKGDVALISDAGTPALNDPGTELVRAAWEAGHQVCPVPGPCAPIAALVASGLSTESFLYLGYLPRKTAERHTVLRQVAELPYTLIFLEAPHRLLVTLTDLQTVLGDRFMAIARELTKVHEQIWRGMVSAALAYFEENPPRGEFTLVVAGKSKEANRWSQEQVRQAIQAALQQGESLPELAARLSQEASWERRDIYQCALQEKRKLP